MTEDKQAFIASISAACSRLLVFLVMRKNVYKYVVNYRFESGDGRSGEGRTFLTRTSRIETQVQIVALEELLKKDNGFSSLFIVNYKLLSA